MQIPSHPYRVLRIYLHLGGRMQIKRICIQSASICICHFGQQIHMLMMQKALKGTNLHYRPRVCILMQKAMQKRGQMQMTWNLHHSDAR